MLAAIADMAAGKRPLGRFHDPEAAKLRDLVVRSYIVADRNNYKDGVLAGAEAAR
jgi:hypothetical protein